MEQNSWPIEKEYEFTKNLNNDTSYLTFIKPILVVDGVLITTELNNKGEIELDEIEYAPIQFYYNSQNYNRNSYMIDIVSIKSFKKYIKIAEARHKSIFNEILNKRKDLYKQ